MENVRLVGIDSLEAIAALEAAIFPDAWSRDAIASHLNSPSGIAYLATDEDKKAIGYLLGLHLGEEAELLRVGVLPEHRHLGIGRWLVDVFLFYLKIEDVAACFLEVREGNSAALGLYEECDFVVTGRRKNYYKNPTEDALLMKKCFP
ncbi:MAG: ribosomal protein S18-alanine N-acetyltransferase [Clostridia bacterium]|nr:ribosomal protein S18-alanine N-acetyltransferase [Clostridia bacterium]